MVRSIHVGVHLRALRAELPARAISGLAVGVVFLHRANSVGDLGQPIEIIVSILARWRCGASSITGIDDIAHHICTEIQHQAVGIGAGHRVDGVITVVSLGQTATVAVGKHVERAEGVVTRRTDQDLHGRAG